MAAHGESCCLRTKSKVALCSRVQSSKAVSAHKGEGQVVLQTSVLALPRPVALFLCLRKDAGMHLQTFFPCESGNLS